MTTAEILWNAHFEQENDQECSDGYSTREETYREKILTTSTLKFSELNNKNYDIN